MSRCRPFPDGALFWCLGCPGSSTARGCRNVADACSTDPDAGVLGALATDYLSTPGPDRSVVGDDQPADSYGRTVDHADSSIGLPSASHSAVRHGSGSVHTDTSRSAPSEPLHSSAASEQRPSFAVDDVLGESIDGTTGARHAEPHSSGGIFAGVQCGCSGDGRDRPPVKCGESSPLGLCPRGLRQAQGESLPRDLPRRSLLHPMDMFPLEERQSGSAGLHQVQSSYECPDDPTSPASLRQRGIENAPDGNGAPSLEPKHDHVRVLRRSSEIARKGGPPDKRNRETHTGPNRTQRWERPNRRHTEKFTWACRSKHRKLEKRFRKVHVGMRSKHHKLEKRFRKVHVGRFRLDLKSSRGDQPSS